jgi:dTDP-4-dehydrorhamnose reductase
MAVDYAITGGSGQLGRALQARCAERDRSCSAPGHQEVAVESASAVAAWLDRTRPAHVLHGAAWTDVDGCERDPARAELHNGVATAQLAAACAQRGIGMVYVSTDFVFDGTASTPYRPDAATAPLSAYGRSKRTGELAVLGHGRADFHVVRTSWVFGPHGKNFPKAILQRAQSGQPLAVVTDQRGRPTYAPDLAEALLDLVERRAPGGIYHAANQGECTWHEFAGAVLAAAGLGHVEIGHTTAAQLARPAARPAYSVLDTSDLDRVRGRSMPDYPSAIARWLRAEQLP